MPFAFAKSLLVASLLALGASFTPAKAQSAGNYAYQLVTTIESVVPGGFGRSKVSYTPAYKGIKESPMENLFSLTA